MIPTLLNTTMTNNRIVGSLYTPYPAVNLANIDLINNVVYHADPKTTILLQMSFCCLLQSDIRYTSSALNWSIILCE